jgi:hypothetical protein
MVQSNRNLAMLVVFQLLYGSQGIKLGVEEDASEDMEINKKDQPAPDVPAKDEDNNKTDKKEDTETMAGEDSDPLSPELVPEEGENIDDGDIEDTEDEDVAEDDIDNYPDLDFPPDAP